MYECVSSKHQEAALKASSNIPTLRHTGIKCVRGPGSFKIAASKHHLIEGKVKFYCIKGLK